MEGEEERDTMETLLGMENDYFAGSPSTSGQSQSSSYWNVHNRFGFPSWPAHAASSDFESLQIEVSL
jgi:hypothetical protein